MSLCPFKPQRQISKQQGTLKGGCSLVVKPLLCTPPWSSVQEVKGGKSSTGGHCPMADVKANVKPSLGKIWSGEELG